MARTWSWPIPLSAAMNVRRMCGFCVDDQIVIVPLPGSKCATTPLGSIADGARRWFTIRCEMTISAFLNAASMAESSTSPDALTPVPLGTSATARLFGKSACTSVGLPVIAVSRSTTAGSMSYVTTIASAASRATYRSLATTTATGSPPYRTVSTATARCSGEGNGVPIGIGANISAICFPVNTASTPSIASAALVSMEMMRPCAISLRLKTMCCMPTSAMSST